MRVASQNIENLKKTATIIGEKKFLSQNAVDVGSEDKTTWRTKIQAYTLQKFLESF